MNVRRELERRLSAALQQITGRQALPAMVAPSARPALGDYQANGVMSAAKVLGTDPRKLAEKVAATAELGDLAESVEAAGPGFVNIRLKGDWIARRLAAVADDEKLGAEPPEKPQTVVVDYSGPNLAKEMHVGHLRSTIIGDALARTLKFVGHTVKRQNHVGDWGTQFGMLVAFFDKLSSSESGGFSAPVHISDLEEYYRQAKQLYDSDPEFARLSRQYVVKLQSGDPPVRQSWERFRLRSWQHCADIYERLKVKLTHKDLCGESAYKDALRHVVSDLDEAGVLKESQGAKCVFLPEFKGKDGEPLPVIVQKSDGGYLYATTDLAAIRHRVNELKADRILYVVDSRQGLHFQQVFAVASDPRVGFAPERVSLEHVAFGVMLGADGRPFKTREGVEVKLAGLIDEAVKRAADLIQQKNPDMPPAQKAQVAAIVGIGALKYADLCQNRGSDYVFSFDKMLSLDGNTAPYMQYAYARVRSIFRKGRADAADLAGEAITLATPPERALGLKLLQFAEVVQAVADQCLPNLLCGYLYDLAVAFTGFYENCPVLKADPPTRAGRLALCELTARVIRQGLGLLGIKTVEQM